MDGVVPVLVVVDVVLAALVYGNAFAPNEGLDSSLLKGLSVEEDELMSTDEGLLELVDEDVSLPKVEELTALVDEELLPKKGDFVELISGSVVEV